MLSRVFPADGGQVLVGSALGFLMNFYGKMLTFIDKFFTATTNVSMQTPSSGWAVPPMPWMVNTSKSSLKLHTPCKTIFEFEKLIISLVFF